MCSIWRSLQSSPLLLSPSLAQPSMAQLDLVATVCPHPQSQSAPCLYPIQAPAIMSSLIWSCHTSADTYLHHAVTFCPTGVKKALQRFSSSPFLFHFGCCFILLFLFTRSHSLTLSPSHSFSWLLSLPPFFSQPPTPCKQHLLFPSALLLFIPAFLCFVCYKKRKK